MEYRLGPTLLSAAEIRARVRELAQAISRDYAGRDLLLICVLKGAAIFWADLCRALQVPCQSDFVAMESYSDATAPLGKPRFTKAAGVSLEDRDVLIVEDIIDTGHTIVHLRHLLQAHQPRPRRPRPHPLHLPQELKPFRVLRRRLKYHRRIHLRP